MVLVDPQLARALSNVLILVPVLYFAYLYLKGEHRRAMDFLAAYMFLVGFVLLVKFVIKAPRPPGAETHFDPYGFPSFHTAYAFLLCFLVPNVLTALYGISVGVLRVLAGVHTWWDVLGGSIFACVAFHIYRFGERRVGLEWRRQSFHMGLGALLGLVLYKSWLLGLYIIVAALAAGAVLYFLRNTRYIKPFLREFDRDGSARGVYTFVIGTLLAVLINPRFAWVAVWFLGYMDAVATMAGKLAGTRGKSFVGSVAALFTGILVAAAAAHDLHSFIILAGIAAVLVFVERYAPFDDNIAIPAVAALLGWLM